MTERAAAEHRALGASQMGCSTVARTRGQPEVAAGRRLRVLTLPPKNAVGRSRFGCSLVHVDAATHDAAAHAHDLAAAVVDGAAVAAAARRLGPVGRSMRRGADGRVADALVRTPHEMEVLELAVVRRRCRRADERVLHHRHRRDGREPQAFRRPSRLPLTSRGAQIARQRARANLCTAPYHSRSRSPTPQALPRDRDRRAPPHPQPRLKLRTTLPS